MKCVGLGYQSSHFINFNKNVKLHVEKMDLFFSSLSDFLKFYYAHLPHLIEIGSLLWAAQTDKRHHFQNNFLNAREY